MAETVERPIPMEKIEAFCRRFGVVEFSIFGSYLREDFDSRSDVDVLTVMGPEHEFTLEKYMEMRDELSAMFGGRKVDLVEKRNVTNPYRRRHILANRRIVYAA